MKAFAVTKLKQVLDTDVGIKDEYVILQYGSALLQAEVGDSDFDIVVTIAEKAFELSLVTQLNNLECQEALDDPKGWILFEFIPSKMRAAGFDWVLPLQMAKAPIIKAKLSEGGSLSSYLDISFAIVTDMSKLSIGVMALNPIDEASKLSLSAVSHCQVI